MNQPEESLLGGPAAFVVFSLLKVAGYTTLPAAAVAAGFFVAWQYAVWETVPLDNLWVRFRNRK